MTIGSRVQEEEFDLRKQIAEQKLSDLKEELADWAYEKGNAEFQAGSGIESAKANVTRIAGFIDDVETKIKEQQAAITDVVNAKKDGVAASAFALKIKEGTDARLDEVTNEAPDFIKGFKTKETD